MGKRWLRCICFFKAIALVDLNDRMQRHARKGREELAGLFSQWHDARQISLKDALRRVVPKCDENNTALHGQLFAKLAPILEPTDEEERKIDETLKAGRPVANGLEGRLKDFAECREIFYTQQALVLSVIQDIKASGQETTLEGVKHQLPDVCLDAHMAAINDDLVKEKRKLSKNSAKKLRKGKDDSKESHENNPMQDWFVSCLLPLAIKRDLYLSFESLKSQGPFTADSLFNAFQSLGMVPPNKDVLEAMLKDVRGARDFQDVANVLKDLLE